MKYTLITAESASIKGEGWPVTSADADIENELTAKEEVSLDSPSSSVENSATIEHKVGYEADAASRPSPAQQLGKFEKKLEHDDPGNQPR